MGVAASVSCCLRHPTARIQVGRGSKRLFPSNQRNPGGVGPLVGPLGRHGYAIHVWIDVYNHVIYIYIVLYSGMPMSIIFLKSSIIQKITKPHKERPYMIHDRIQGNTLIYLLIEYVSYCQDQFFWAPPSTSARIGRVSRRF